MSDLAIWLFWIVLVLAAIYTYMEFHEFVLGARDFPDSPVTGVESLIGRQVEVLSEAVDQAGRFQVRLDGEIWFAKTTAGVELQSGDRARVVRCDGLILTVTLDADA